MNDNNSDKSDEELSGSEDDDDSQTKEHSKPGTSKDTEPTGSDPLFDLDSFLIETRERSAVPNSSSRFRSQNTKGAQKLSQFLNTSKPIFVPSIYETGEEVPQLVINRHVLVDLKETFMVEDSLKFNEIGFAVWLNTVQSAKAPALACSIAAASHPDWCAHTCYVWIMRPQLTDPITWKEEKKLPVMCCLKTLVVNPFNRNMFAAGTISGDIYIWTYDCQNEDNPVKELFGESSRVGSVMDMDFYQLSPLTDDYVLLTCHDDGMVCSWKIGRIVVLDKKVRFFNANLDDIFPLTTICNIYGSNFFVGTLNGSILGPCTLSRTIDSTNGKHQDCVFEVYYKQSFSIIRLQKVLFRGTECIISCDYSSELRFYKTDNLFDKSIFEYRLPLLSDHQSLILDNYVVIARPGGEVFYFKLEEPGAYKVENTLRGPSSCIALSKNQKWLVTGSFEGKFQVFTVENDNL